MATAPTIPAPVARGLSLSDRVRRLAAPLWWIAVALISASGWLAARDLDGSVGATRTALLALVVLTTAALIAGQRWPASSLVVVYTAVLATVLLVPDDPRATVTFASPLAAYAVGRRASSPAMRLSVGFAIAVWLLVQAIGGDDAASVGSIVSVGAFFIVAPVAIGRGVRDRQRLRDVLEQRAAVEEAGRQRSTSDAQLDERARIAGEPHDVVAHALSAMVLQASGARVQAEHDAATARDAFSAVEQTGRDALYEIRSLLGILREDGAGEELLEPQPSVEHLPALTARSTRAGLPTTLTFEGEAFALPAGASLAGYRTVQEALRSARDEGGAGRAEVIVRFEPSAVRIVITDDGPGDRAPLAVGERVRLYGGALESRDDAASGGRRVELRLRSEARR